MKWTRGQLFKDAQTRILSILSLILLFHLFYCFGKTSIETICEKENISRGDSLKMSVLLDDIRALASANDQIIETIEKKRTENAQVKSYKYQVQFNYTSKHFVIIAVLEEKPASVIVDSWTWPNQGATTTLQINQLINQNSLSALKKRTFLVPVKDYFNDKLDLKCSRFTDFQTLNVKMLEVAEKFELFGEGSEKAREELEKWRQNFEVVKSGLEQIGSSLSNRKNNVDQVQLKIDALNQMLHHDILKTEDVVFDSKPKNFAVGRVTATYPGYRLVTHSELTSPVVQQEMLKEYKEKNGFPLLEKFKAETAFHTGSHWIKLGDSAEYLVDGLYMSSSLANPCKLKGHLSGKTYEEENAKLVIAEASLAADSSYPALFCQE